MGSAREDEVKGEPEYKISPKIREAISKRSHSFRDTVQRAQDTLNAYKPTSKRKEAYGKFKNSLDNAVFQSNTDNFIALFNSAVSFPPRDDTEASIKAWEARNFCKYVPRIKDQLGKKRLYGHVNAIAQSFISRTEFFEQFKDNADLAIAVLKDESLRTRLDAEDIADILKPWFDLEKRNTDEDREHRKRFLKQLKQTNFDCKKIIINEIPFSLQNIEFIMSDDPEKQKSAEYLNIRAALGVTKNLDLRELVALLPSEAKVDVSEDNIQSLVRDVYGENVLDAHRGRSSELNTMIREMIDDRIRLLTKDRMKTALKDHLSKLPINRLHDFVSGSPKSRIKIARELVQDVCNQPAFSDVQSSDHVKVVLQAYDPEMVCRLVIEEVIDPYIKLLELHENYNKVFELYDQISQEAGEEAYRELFDKYKAEMKATEIEIKRLASKDPTQETKDEIKLCEQALIKNFLGFVDLMFAILSEAPETETLYGFTPRLQLMLYQAFAVADVRGAGPFFDSNAIREIHAGLVVEYARCMRNPREYPFFKGRDDGGDLPQKYSIRMPCFVSEAKNERPFADPEKPEHITPNSLTQFAARWKKVCEVHKIPEPFALQMLIQAINNIEIGIKDDNHPLPTGWCDSNIKPILNSIATYQQAKNDRTGYTKQYINRLEKGTARAGDEEKSGLSSPIPGPEDSRFSIGAMRDGTVGDYDRGIGIGFFHKKSAGVEKIRLAFEVIMERHNKNESAILNSDDIALLLSVEFSLNQDPTIHQTKTPGTWLARTHLINILGAYESEKKKSTPRRSISGGHPG